MKASVVFSVITVFAGVVARADAKPAAAKAAPAKAAKQWSAADYDKAVKTIASDAKTYWKKLPRDPKPHSFAVVAQKPQAISSCVAPDRGTLEKQARALVCQGVPCATGVEKGTDTVMIVVEATKAGLCGVKASFVTQKPLVDSSNEQPAAPATPAARHPLKIPG
jgi:hypothetical protein